MSHWDHNYCLKRMCREERMFLSAPVSAFGAIAKTSQANAALGSFNGSSPAEAIGEIRKFAC